MILSPTLLPYFGNFHGRCPDPALFTEIFKFRVPFFECDIVKLENLFFTEVAGGVLC